MALVHTIPQTDATIPTFIRNAGLYDINGRLPAEWLRSFDGSTRIDYKLFVPVSYAMEAMHLQGIVDGIWLKTTGRNRPYAQQENLFRSRYAPSPVTTRGSKIWNGVRWYNQRGAMAAVPGTSNHGWAIADDVSEDDTGDDIGESINDEDLQWLKDNARSFGWALDIHSEPWHWHWYNGDALTQRTVDVLAAFGITIPDLSPFGFTVPAPTNQGDDDMKDDEREALFEIRGLMLDDAFAQKRTGYPSFFTMLNQVRSAVFPSGVTDSAGRVLANAGTLVKRIAAHLKLPTT